MYYKIGTLAKLFGITTQALRFYEREGMLAPERMEGSTTRRYHTRNFKWLYSIRNYHELGFCMDEIRSLFECEDIDGLQTQVDAKIDVMREQIAYMQHLVQLQENLSQDIARIREDTFACRIEDSEARYYLFNQHDQVLDESNEMEKLVMAWLRNIPVISCASFCPLEELEARSVIYPRASGFLIPVEDAQRLGVPVQDPVILRPSQRVLRTIVPLCDGHVHFDRLYDYLDEHNLEPCGDAYGRLLLKVGEARCKARNVRPDAVYYEYDIPICVQGTHELPELTHD